MQKRACGGLSVPHVRQPRARPVPHCMQKRASCGFSVPQLVQRRPSITTKTIAAATLYGGFGLGTPARAAGADGRDGNAARERDPATRGVGATEILAMWPGVHAI